MIFINEKLLQAIIKVHVHTSVL